MVVATTRFNAEPSLAGELGTGCNRGTEWPASYVPTQHGPEGASIGFHAAKSAASCSSLPLCPPPPHPTPPPHPSLPASFAHRSSSRKGAGLPSRALAAFGCMPFATG